MASSDDEFISSCSSILLNWTQVDKNTIVDVEFMPFHRLIELMLAFC